MTEVADGRHAGTRALTFAALLDQWLEWNVRRATVVVANLPPQEDERNADSLNTLLTDP